MKVFIIAMPWHAGSQERADVAMGSALEQGYDACKFTACDPLQGLEVIHSRNLHAGHTGPYGALTDYKGAVGCYGSHYLLWERCAEMGETIIIAEHDALFTRRWDNPQFADVLHLNCHGSSVRKEWAPAARGDSIAPIQDGVYRMNFKPFDWPGYTTMPCNYAYAIKPHAAVALLADARINGHGFADRVIREPVVIIETINPPIAIEQEAAKTLSTTR